MQLQHPAQSKWDIPAHPDLANASAGKISRWLDRRFPVYAFQETRTTVILPPRRICSHFCFHQKPTNFGRLSSHKNTRLPPATAHHPRASRPCFPNSGSYRLTGTVISRGTAQAIAPLNCAQASSKPQDERTNLLSENYVLRPCFGHGLTTEKFQKESYPFVPWQNLSNYGFKPREGATN